MDGGADVQQDAGAAIAVIPAPGPPTADSLRAIDPVKRAHRLLPIMAPPQHKMPIKVEVLKSAQARKTLRLVFHKTLHFLEGGSRIQNQKPLLEALDPLKGLVKLFIGEVHQVRGRVSEKTRSQLAKRV